MKKKICVLTLAGLISLGAFAQTKTAAAGRTSVGITGGVNWNNINGKTATGADLENKLKTGFNGGINLEIPVGTASYLQPGVEFRQKGAEMSNGSEVQLSYVDVPVNFVYKPALGSGNMVLGFGPYVGFGVGGKVTANGTERDVKFTNEYSASEAADIQFKKMDAGANFMAGYEFANNLSFGVKAQLGLVDINPKTNIPNDQTKYRNTGFGVSLGYRF